MHRIVSATVHPAMRLILLALALCLSDTASAEEPDEGLDHHPFLREPERCCELIASFAEQAAREAMLPNG